VPGLSPGSIPVSRDAPADRVTFCVPRETGSPLPGASLPAPARGNRETAAHSRSRMSGGGAHWRARDCSRSRPVSTWGRGKSRRVLSWRRPDDVPNEESRHISLAPRERVAAERGRVREGRRPGTDPARLRTGLQEPCAASGSQEDGAMPPTRLSHPARQIRGRLSFMGRAPCSGWDKESGGERFALASF
jgi:hypothetical protein